MKYCTHSYRHGETILKDEKHAVLYYEVLDAIDSISDEELKEKHLSYEKKIDKKGKPKRRPMSLSVAINDVLKEKLVAKGWSAESAIFQEAEYSKKKEHRWRLDFAKGNVSVEVAFNHGEAIAWNLMKPVMASQENNVKKAIETDAAIVIAATAALKEAGGFDSAIGEYEKILRYFRPLNNILTAPLVVVGLDAPETFRLEKVESGGKTKTSRIIDFSPS